MCAPWKALDEDVTHLRDHFAPNAPDEEWIPQIGTRGWKLVSHDVRIVRNPQQRLILEKAGIVSFMCTGGIVNKPAWEQFTWLVRAWPQIKAQAEAVQGAATFRVTINHKVERWKR